MLSEKGGNQQLLLLVELEYLRTYTLYDLQNRDSQAAARAQLAVIDCHVCGELERLLYHSIGYYLAHLIALSVQRSPLGISVLMLGQYYKVAKASRSAHLPSTVKAKQPLRALSASSFHRLSWNHTKMEPYLDSDTLKLPR